MRLKNTLAEFQRFMEDCLSYYRGEVSLPYLNDVIIYSKGLEGHVEHFQKVLSRLKDKEIRLKARKCNLFAQEVTYLEYIITEDGYRIDPNGIKLILDLETRVIRRSSSAVRVARILLLLHSRIFTYCNTDIRFNKS